MDNQNPQIVSTTLPAVVLPANNKSHLKRNILIAAVGVIILIILLIFGVMYYFTDHYLAYSDFKYGFLIKDQRGWYSVPKENSLYYSLGTADSNRKVVSYFGVDPVAHIGNNLKNNPELFKKTCTENAKENNVKFVNTVNVTVNNLEGLICINEGQPTYADRIYILKQYFLFNKEGENYDYVITVSYPKDNPVEEDKVQKIIDNFYAK